MTPPLATDPGSSASTEAAVLTCPQCGNQRLRVVNNYVLATLCGNLETFVPDGTYDITCPRCNHSWSTKR